MKKGHLPCGHNGCSDMVNNGIAIDLKSSPEVLLHHAIIFLWIPHNSNKDPLGIGYGWVAFDVTSTDSGC